VIKVTIFSKPNCPGCKATKASFKMKGIEFEEIDLTQHPEEVTRIKDEWGFNQAPVVLTPFDVWSGYRPEKIKETERDIRAEGCISKSE
jgi:glutaredoxin-like protein NrdH